MICRMQTKCIWPEDPMIGDVAIYHDTTCNQVLFNCAGNTVQLMTGPLTDGISDGTMAP